jgi:hypothetical protein
LPIYLPAVTNGGRKERVSLFLLVCTDEDNVSSPSPQTITQQNKNPERSPPCVDTSMGNYFDARLSCYLLEDKKDHFGA